MEFKEGLTQRPVHSSRHVKQSCTGAAMAPTQPRGEGDNAKSNLTQTPIGLSLSILIHYHQLAHLLPLKVLSRLGEVFSVMACRPPELQSLLACRALIHLPLGYILALGTPRLQEAKQQEACAWLPQIANFFIFPCANFDFQSILNTLWRREGLLDRTCVSSGKQTR